MACGTASAASAGGVVWVARDVCAPDEMPVHALLARASSFESFPDWTPQVELVRLDAETWIGKSIGAAPGSEPSLVRLASGALLLVQRESGGEAPFVARRSPADGATWSAPVALPLPDRVLGCSPPCIAPAGSLFVAARFADEKASGIGILRSHDEGATWDEALRWNDVAADDLRLAALDDGTLVLAMRRGPRVATARSADAGVTWSAPEEVGIAIPDMPALVGDRDALSLVWAAEPDPRMDAPPALHALRAIRSRDGGRTWGAAATFLARPGRRLASPVVTPGPAGWLLLARETHDAGEPQLVCTRLDPAAFDTMRRCDRGEADLAARDALRVLCAHTAARPRRAPRLFVEGYFMRTLIAAHTVLGAHGWGDSEMYDSEAGLARAIDWADSLVIRQSFFGFWKTGYHALYYADMGAAAGIFPALEPWVDATRAARYERAVEKFLRGLDGEHMLLANGAVGIGRSMVVDPLAMANRMRFEPYLVSTALAGIEARAWLYKRTGRPELRDAALAALDYTLSQITADGFAEKAARDEGCLRVAGYVQEGWMAADAYLDDARVLRRLRAALPQHVAWLLRTQGPDGGWDGGAAGEFARTPAIVDFLVWHEARIGPRADVRAAIERARAALVDPERWPETGMFRTGDHYEVLRAVAGRSLAALVAGKGVP